MLDEVHLGLSSTDPLQNRLVLDLWVQRCYMALGLVIAYILLPNSLDLSDVQHVLQGLSVGTVLDKGQFRLVTPWRATWIKLPTR